MSLDLPPTVRYEVRERVGVLTLDRPKAKNAFSREMYAAVRDVARTVRTDPAVDVLVIAGAGGAFSVGGDLKEMRAILSGPDRTEILGYEDHLPFEAVRQLPKPTIAVIDGLCMGGGLTLALMCDMRIATRTSTFAIPEARVGIVDGHLPRLLRDRVPPAVLRRWMYTGAPFTAHDAWHNGLLSELADDGDDLAHRLETLLADLDAASKPAIARLKCIFNEVMPLSSMSDAYDSLLNEDVLLQLRGFGAKDKADAAQADERSQS